MPGWKKIFHFSALRGWGVGDLGYGDREALDSAGDAISNQAAACIYGCNYDEAISTESEIAWNSIDAVLLVALFQLRIAPLRPVENSPQACVIDFANALEFIGAVPLREQILEIGLATEMAIRLIIVECVPRR